MRTIKLNLLGAAIAAFASLFMGPLHAAPSDKIIVAAARAFQKKDAARLARYIEPARAHVLGQYVEYWALRLSLDQEPVEAVRDFIERFKGDYVADRLHREWLRSLARRGQWELFQAEHAGFVGQDPEIACYALLSRHRLGETVSLDTFRPIWRTPSNLPEGCMLLTARLAQAGRLEPDLVWQRARALAERGYTTSMKRALGYLPAKESLAPSLVNRIVANPLRVLGPKSLNLSTRSGREFYAFALGRLARRDPQQAFRLFTPAIQAKFPDAERANAFAQLALPSARSHHPEAVNWYARTDKGVLSEEQLAWRVRAALRAHDWSDVERATALMEPAQKGDTPWMYWRARALRELGQPEAAEALFNKIAGQYNFYGNLASEEVGMPVVIPTQTSATTQKELAAITRDAGLQKAIALLRLHLRSEALGQWAFATRSLSDRTLLAAAEFARRNQVWDRAISTADRTRKHHDFRLRYLTPYRDVFASHAELLGLDESWVLGLARQESRFIVNAKSPVGASGLMQLMPKTARLVARRIGMKRFSTKRLNEPEVNVRLGTSFLRFILDDLDGHPLLASAGYNAGPRRAQEWRAAIPIEGAIYAESIPFNETRNYVKRVFSNTMYYARLQGGEITTLKTRLGTVQPRATSVAPVMVASGS